MRTAILIAIVIGLARPAAAQQADAPDSEAPVAVVAAEEEAGREGATPPAPPPPADLQAARSVLDAYVQVGYHGLFDIADHPDLMARARAHIEGVRWLMDHAEEDLHRRMALELLLHAHRDAMRADILHAVRNASPVVRSRAVGFLYRYRVLDGRALTDQYTRLLEDESALVRAAAAGSLRSHPSPRAVGPLVALLNDPFIEVRFVAAGTLMSWDLPEARAALQRAAESDNVVVAGTVAAESARRGLEPADLPAIHAYLQRELEELNDPAYAGAGLVTALINLLGEKGDESSLRVLNEAMTHRYRFIREAAREAIDRIEER